MLPDSRTNQPIKIKLVEDQGVYNGELYAGGNLTTAGGVSANYIAKWNGTSWQPVGGGMGSYGYVYALCVYSSELYAGGYF